MRVHNLPIRSGVQVVFWSKRVVLKLLVSIAIYSYRCYIYSYINAQLRLPSPTDLTYLDYATNIAYFSSITSK